MRDTPSRTAEAVCFMRASDQRRRPDQRILDDPYAKLFLGHATRAALAALEAGKVLGDIAARAESDLFGLTPYVQARHRFIDDRLQEALASKDLAQVVLLGAGYDTRAYRFASSIGDRPVFEVDHPSTSRRKAQIVRQHHDELPRPKDLRIVEIDFEEETLEEKLMQAGLKTGVRTFFVWEGVSMYLTRKALQATLSTIRSLSAAGSDLAMDFWYFVDSPDIISTAHRMSVNLLHFLGEPITFGIHPEDVGAFMGRIGYDVVDLADAAELERRYVRDDRRVYPANFVLHARTRE